MATFLRLLGFLRPYRRGVVLSGALAACAMAMTAAIPWLTGRAIDQMREGDRSGLRVLALAVLGAGVLRVTLTVARRLIAGRVSLGGELARAGAVRRGDRGALRAPLAPRAAGGPAADRRADRRRRGERRRRARREGVRARGAPARALPPPGRPRLRPGDGLDAAAGVLQPVHRLPAPGLPRRDPVPRRPPGHPRRADGRPVQRVLRLPSDAAVADSDARHLAR